ncbi:hypothetical protein, partial [Streptomyces sp. NPDC058759]|uniref:hypothetical protein n=1 Tax=Streptomyces sp. NPDC058759 TaxID=3346628 RepID=UPI00369D2F2C
MSARHETTTARIARQTSPVTIHHTDSTTDSHPRGTSPEPGTDGPPSHLPPDAGTDAGSGQLAVGVIRDEGVVAGSR